MTAPRSRQGFTFVQLLILLAILLFLLAFLLPAIAQVRRAAGRSQSFNNIRQLAIAVHNAHDTFQKMPPMYGQLGNQTGTLHFHLLPYIEQQALYQRAEGAVWKNNINATIIPIFLDPEDKHAPPNNQFKNWLATTNYAGNWHIFKQGELTLAQIQDGTSNTFMFTQCYQVCNGTPTAWGYPGLYTWTAMFGYYNQGKFQNLPAAEDCDPTLTQAISPGGIQVGMADGSGRYISDRISPQTWWLLTDPADGQAIPADFND